MITRKNFTLNGMIDFTGAHLLWLILWVTGVALLYQYTSFSWDIPFLPISLIGTAVAFYVGFKNNQAYDRLWEARKVWGAIINSSRIWSTTVKGYLSDQFLESETDQKEIDASISRLIKRHIAWLYTLRSQLLIPTEWEHINQGFMVSATAKARMNKYGVGLVDDGQSKEAIQKYLEPGECQRVINFQNTATQLIDEQTQDLKELRRKGIIEDFRHMELQNILAQFYVHQGKCERIKKFPLPRQYGSMSIIFVSIFIFLLPFGMVTEFMKFGSFGAFLSIPFTVTVGWVFLVMELVGDYSENPFEGMPNDIPMLALCRTIEIDLLEMLGESEIPPGIKSNNGVLM